MGTYVLVYTGGDQPSSEDEGKAVMDAWMAWFGQLGEAVTDGGNPFGPSMTVAPDGSVTEGNVSRASGYSIITAPDLAAATELAKDCPHLSANGTVEVFETFDVM
jgi:hypothetical protein